MSTINVKDTFFQQKTYDKIKPGRERVRTLEKEVRILKKKYSEYESQITLWKSHQVSRKMD